ncbi:hypothetical protein YQE_05338, partial [Dendroctonus ponderosae]
MYLYIIPLVVNVQTLSDGHCGISHSEEPLAEGIHWKNDEITQTLPQIPSDSTNAPQKALFDSATERQMHQRKWRCKKPADSTLNTYSIQLLS